MEVKLFFMFAVIASTIHAYSIETEDEKYDCLVNYLRDKKLINKNFKYVPKLQQLECKPFIEEFSETFIQDIQDGVADESDGDEWKQKLFDDAIQYDFECIRDKLYFLKYPEEKMKSLIYSDAETSSNALKKLTELSKRIAMRKFKMAVSVCYTEAFESMFDELTQKDDEMSIDYQQTDYCVRKYVLDKKLIDRNEYSVVLNPDKLETNFRCRDKVDEALDILGKILLDDFDFEGSESKQQSRCMSYKIRNKSAVDYMARTIVAFGAVSTSDDRNAVRAEFLEEIRNHYLEMVKCVV